LAQCSNNTKLIARLYSTYSIATTEISSHNGNQTHRELGQTTKVTSLPYNNNSLKKHKNYKLKYKLELNNSNQTQREPLLDYKLLGKLLMMNSSRMSQLKLNNSLNKLKP
jgi:hypothetical protein